MENHWMWSEEHRDFYWRHPDGKFGRRSSIRTLSLLKLVGTYLWYSTTHPGQPKSPAPPKRRTYNQAAPSIFNYGWPSSESTAHLRGEEEGEDEDDEEDLGYSSEEPPNLNLATHGSDGKAPVQTLAVLEDMALHYLP